MEFLHQFGIVLIAFFIGGLVGLTGMGGGSLLTPALIILFNVQPIVALGTGFLAGAVTRIVGGWNHWRLGNVDFATVRILLRGSLPGVVVGFIILKMIERFEFIHTDVFVRQSISVGLFLVAASMFYRSLWVVLQERAARLGQERRGRWMKLYSFGSSLLIGVSSVGTGTLLVPFLIAFFPGSLATVVGTNVVHGAVISAASAALHGAAGSIDWQLALPLTAGLVPGILLGSHLSVFIPKRVLEFILASTLLTTSVKLI